MLQSSFSYIDAGRMRQTLRAVRVITVALLALDLIGCTGFGRPVVGQTGVESNLATGSIEKADSVKSESPVAQSDWETVSKSIARAASDDSLNGVLAWDNPDTGSTGTLKVLGAVSLTENPDCRDFQTTVNDVRGIRRYRGEACRTANDRWKLYGVLAEDAELL